MSNLYEGDEWIVLTLKGAAHLESHSLRRGAEVTLCGLFVFARMPRKGANICRVCSKLATECDAETKRLAREARR